MKRALVLLSLIATNLVFGEDALEAANDPRAAQLKYEPWSKVCLAGSNCFVAAGARATCSPSGGVISINVVNGKNASLSATFLTRHSLEGTISAQIDEDAPILIPNLQCYPVGCTGKLEIDSELIERLRRSQVIEATNTAQRKIRLSFSLAGFAEAYDGPGAEPRAVEEILTSDEMKERMKQAEKARTPECEE